MGDVIPFRRRPKPADDEKPATKPEIFLCFGMGGPPLDDDPEEEDVEHDD